MYLKLIKNEKKLLINRMVGTDKNTTKIHFFNLTHGKYNDKTKQTEERVQINKKRLKIGKGYRGNENRAECQER